VRVIQELKLAPADWSVAHIAKMIDHSLLRPNLTPAELANGLALARDYQIGSVCVRPCDVAAARRSLQGTIVLCVAVVGFPHGSQHTDTKVYEARQCMGDGATELDMVLAIGHLLGGDEAYVEQDIRAVVEAAHARSVLVKVMLETCYLDREQIVSACQVCERAGADYVKTSTGYGPRGATVEEVELMRQSCSPRVAVKAAGGIRTLAQLLRFYQAGATRFGTRATQVILDEARQAYATTAFPEN
jgi:deoxyribose-phosphate aldolase